MVTGRRVVSGYVPKELVRWGDKPVAAGRPVRFLGVQDVQWP
jgi:hypothetical protein